MSGKPFWKNPFVLAFFAGVVLVTLAVPRFRRVSPPPEVTGTLPAFTLVDQHGTTLASADLAGRVTLIGLVTAREPEASASVAQALEALRPRFATAGAEVKGLLVDLDGRDAEARRAWLAGALPTAPNWSVAGGAGACAFAAAAFEAGGGGSACDAALRAAREGRLALVDAAGQVRGLHGSSPAALYETFERTLRACDLARGGS